MKNMGITDSVQEFKKLLILGLDNSGKTSIVLSLMKNTNLLTYCSLKPTIDIERDNYEYAGTNFSFWDFGGQERYRKNHLQNLDKHLSNVSKIIYVIDVQDIKRYELSLQYLEDILEIVKKINYHFEFLLFLHKFDPGLEKLEQFSDERISVALIEKIKKIIPSNFDYKMFKTSIYTIFQKTLIS